MSSSGGNDFSSLTPFEIYLFPLVRDSDILLPGFLGWFLVQFLTNLIFNVLSSKYRALPKGDKDQFGIRMCAIVNGLAMSNSAYYFITNMANNNWTFDESKMYEVIDGYRPFRLLIVSYFLWDIVVCIAYGWSWTWTLHGIVSFFGTYFLAFPYADQYATYYSGMFELSNALYHIATMTRQLGGPAIIASILEMLFAGMFLLIRILGGTYVTYKYEQAMYELVVSGRAHSSGAVVVCMALVLVVMFLQYVWFSEIVKIALGKGERKEDAKSPTTANAAASASANSTSSKSKNKKDA